MTQYFRSYTGVPISVVIPDLSLSVNILDIPFGLHLIGIQQLS